MAIKLNLLQPELAVDKNLSSLLKMARSLGIIALAGFLIFVVGISAFFIISSFTLRDLTSDIDVSKSQIAAQETSEQQIVLLKDRIKKIGTVRNSPTSLKNLIAIDPFLSTLSPESSVNELSVDTAKISLLLNFKSNNDLSIFLNSLSESDVFKSIVLASFSFSPINGYSVGINIESKE